MATNKMTNKTALEIALAMVQASAHPEKELVAEKLSKQIASLDKKNSTKSDKPTAKQVANMGLGELIVSFLHENADKRFTVTELMKQVEGLPAEITNQKLTGIFRLESVKPHYTRTMDKGRAYFQYKADETAEDVEDWEE